MQIKDLKPNPKNPRQITDRRLDLLQASLAKFGDLSGFVENERTGNLISGHQKQKVIPDDAEIVIEKTYDAPTKCRTVAIGYVVIYGERFKYRRVNTDETWEREAMLAANKHGGSWDNARLSELIAKTPGMNLELAGFEIGEVSVPNIGAPVLPTGHNEEADAEYVAQTEQTTEQIDTEAIGGTKSPAHECPRCGYEFN